MEQIEVNKTKLNIPLLSMGTTLRNAFPERGMYVSKLSDWQTTYNRFNNAKRPKPRILDLMIGPCLASTGTTPRKMREELVAAGYHT